MMKRRMVAYHNVTPLVKSQWKIPVRFDPLGIRWIHNSFTGRANGNWFCQI